MIKTELVLPSGRRRSTRIWRTLRAGWRDTSALLREFRVPLTVFLVATLLGGWLYGEIYYSVTGVRIPYIDLPYGMVHLMTMQGMPEMPAPGDPRLMIFWYLMPLVGLYVIGRGVVDFVRTFFNRGERRRSWEEAVASTYRNHVIVMGIGHVGSRVTRTLAQMNFEVVAIDQKISRELEDELNRLGVPVIVADGRLPASLEKAGLPHAQALIVCTSNDQLNLEVTMRARDMNPTARIVVRSWDAKFAQQLKKFMGVHAVLSASDISAPVFAGAAVGVEIAQTFTLHGITYSMIRLTVSDGSFLAGKTIDALQDREKLDIVLHERNGSAKVHPTGDILVQAGDTLVIFAPHSQIVDIAARNRQT